MHLDLDVRMKRFPLRLCLACLLLSPASYVFAQEPAAVITGTVTDSETGTSLSDAHVFIAVSMNGSVTDAAGAYRLDNVPLGAHRLYVSIVGYEPQALDVFLREPGAHTFDFTLQRAVVEVGEVEVTAERDERWRRRLEKFIRLFIGETPNATHTQILNPEVLDFTDKMGRFTARASETLVIENQALGYRIHYFLKEFAATPNRTMYDGEPLFEEMEPSSVEERGRWQQNRSEAFHGSFRHFMLALLGDRVEESGFVTYHRPPSRENLTGSATPSGQRFPLDITTIIKVGDDEQERILDFHGFVDVVYTQEVEDEAYLAWRGRGGRPKYRSSMILLENGPTVVDLKGDVVDPYGVTFYGYLAFERVADELPKEYRPWH